MNALIQLSPEWQQWLDENVSRGCDPAALVGLMVEKGQYSEADARATVEKAFMAHARGSAIPGFAHTGRADILTGDGKSNLVHTPGQDIEIVMALKTPRIVVLANVLSHEECDQLWEQNAPQLAPSVVVSQVDGSQETHAGRTSRGVMLQRGQSELVRRIEERLAVLTGWPVDHGEGMQVLEYGPGHEYRAHFDWFDPALPGSARHLASGGQRVATIIIYLCDVEQGGATGFPSIGLEVAPRKGSAVFFADVDDKGVPDPLTLHAGLPVVAGVKRIATKWLRERKY